MSDAPWAAWVTLTQVKTDAAQITDRIDDTVFQQCADVASAWLWRMSGRQFSGLCGPLTVYPVSRFYSGSLSSISRFDPSSFNSVGGTYGYPWLYGRGEIANEVTLGVYPVRAVSQVRIDGTAIDPSKYRLDDQRYLVRIDGQPWPAFNNFTLPHGSLGTWDVTLTYGQDPPADGVYAAQVLARELVLANMGDPACRLPDGVQNLSRQGVNMVFMNPQQLLSEGLFGLREVDYFLSSANPDHLRQRGTVISVDVPRSVRL